MAPEPNDPITTSKYNSARPRNLETLRTATAGNGSNLSAVPRSIPRARTPSPSSNDRSASPSTSDYEISSRLRTRYREEDIGFLGVWSESRERRLAVRATSAPSPALSTTASRSDPDGVLEDDDFHRTWMSLISLFDCISIRASSSTEQSIETSGFAGFRQRPGDRSTRSGRPNAHHSRRGTGMARGGGGNHNGHRLTPRDNENDPNDQQDGSGDNDQKSTQDDKRSSQRPFACPFHKFDPVEYATCHKEKFQRIDSVLRHHINGKHIERNHLSSEMLERLSPEKLGRQPAESRWKAIYSAIFDEDLPPHISPYWGQAWYTRDFAENLKVVETATNCALELAEQNRKVMLSELDEEISQAQKRRDMIDDEVTRILKWKRDQEFALATPNTLIDGIFSPESVNGQMLLTPESDAPTPQSNGAPDNQYREVQSALGLDPDSSYIDVPQGTPYAEMSGLPRMEPNISGRGHNNLGYYTGEYGKRFIVPDTIDPSFFQGISVDYRMFEEATYTAAWNQPSSMDIDDCYDIGSQNQILPVRHGVVRHDSGYSSFGMMSTQGGNSRCLLHTHHPDAMSTPCTHEGETCMGHGDTDGTG